MDGRLTARTRAGADVVALADLLADRIAPAAAAHDRDGSFPFASFAAIEESGYLLAPVPEELGGLGVTTLHDLAVASSRLAGGDAGLAIGTNMHLVYALNVVRRWESARAAGDERRSTALGTSLRRLAEDRTVFAAAISEHGQDLTRPQTRATRTGDGWVVSGRKAFCTLSPAADVFYASVTFADADGGERYGYALIPADAPGVVVHDDWDALGMRASGSNSVTFDSVRLPASALLGGFRVGDTVGYMARNLTAGVFHAAAALGIAEAAASETSERLARRDGLDPRTEILAAENAIELSAARAILARAATLVDESHARSLGRGGEREAPDDITALFAETQAAKTFVGEAAARIVERALLLSGGAGYLNGSALARAYRDVRATAFMHPLGANRAYSFLGRLAAGGAPSLH